MIKKSELKISSNHIKNKYNLKYLDKMLISLGLLFILFYQMILFLWWSAVFNEYIPLYDQLEYLKLTKDVYEKLKSGKFSIIFSFLGGNKNKIINSLFPFVLASLFYHIFGFSNNLFLAMNFISLSISIILVYKIGKEILDKKMGILSAFIFSTLPAVYWFSKFYFLEILSLPFILASIYFLIRSNKLKNRKYSILWNFFSFLSILVKNLSWLILPPIFFFEVFRWRMSKRKKIFKKILFGILGFLFALSLYVNAIGFYDISPVSRINLLENTLLRVSTNFSSEIILKIYFLFKMLFIDIGAFYFILFIISITVPFLVKGLYKELNNYIFILGIFILPYILVSSYPMFFYSDPSPLIRPTVISMPFLALLLGFIVSCIKQNSLKNIMILSLVFFVSLYQIIDLNYNLFYGDMIKNQEFNKFEVYQHDINQISFTGEERGFLFNLTELNNFSEFMFSMGNDSKCVISPTLIKEALDFMKLKNNKNIECLSPTAVNMRDDIYSTLINIIEESDIIIISDSDRYFPGWRSYKRVYEEFKDGKGISKNFVLLESFKPTKKPLIVYIYKKVQD